MTNMVRWQSHWHVVRQTLSFFQNDFAGRIGSRVLEIGHTLRGSVVSMISVVWYRAIFGRDPEAQDVKGRIDLTYSGVLPIIR